MIDTRLVTFIALAKYRSYTEAARSLHLTQPAVTQHIQYLESFYGVKLVVRHGGQMHLTPEGELLLSYANKMDALSTEIQRALHNRSGITRRYKIGATLTIGEYVLPTILGRHRRAYPNIDISMSVQNTDTILQELDHANLDLGLIEGPFNRHKYAHRLFKKDHLLLVVAPEHGLAGRGMVEIEELRQEKLIVREAGSGTRMFFEDNLRKRGFSLRDFSPYMEIGNLNAIRSLVLANVGVSVISREVVKAELATGELCHVPIQGMDLVLMARLKWT